MSISISATPSRSSGVAPLYVHFDATGTTSTTESTQRLAFRNLFYLWDFGDTGAGNWSYGQITDKNAARGGVAAHVYETPGSYTATLTVVDSSGDFEQTTIAITVTDPDTVTELSGSNIIVVATDGVFTGKPTGATEVTTDDLSEAIGTLSSTKKKILFKRGQTWTDSADTITNNLAGRVIVGAWGSGAKPIWNYTGSNTNDYFFGYGGTTWTDWSIQDITITSTTETCVSTTGVAVKALFLRVDATGTGSLYCNEFASGSTIHNEVAFVDCAMETSGSYCTYVAVAKGAILGCSMIGTTDGIGTFRTQYFNKSILSNNSITVSASTFHLLKFAAPKSTGGPSQYDGLLTEYSVCSDNELDDSDGAGAWSCAMGPENGSQDERVSDIIIERNWFKAGSANELAFKLWAQNITARNNLIDLSNGADGSNDFIGAFHVDQRGIEPDPAGNEFYNNTVYRGDAGYVGPNAFNIIRLSLGTAMVVKNNIAYTPSETATTMLADSATSTVASNNSTNTQVRSTNPGPSWSSPSAEADFQITSSGYGFEAGASVKVMEDYFGRSRIGVTNDMGFYQVTEGSYPWLAAEQTGIGKTKVPPMRFSGLLR